jgi:predicted Zn-dependent protease
LRSIRKESFKFIEAPKPELYDMRSDSGELRNVYVPWDTEAQRLRKMLAEVNASSPASAKPSPAAVSARTIDELHALGYLGAADARSSTDVPEPSLLPDPKNKIEEQNLLHAAMMAMENDEPAKARTSLEKLLQLDDKSVMALSQLGHLEITSGSYNKALEYLRRAYELRPEDPAAALDYARALELNRDLAGACDVLLASLRLNPNQFSVRLLLGQVYFLFGDPKAAEDQLETAAIMQPENVEAKTSLSKVLISQKKFADVVELLEPLAKSSSNNPDVFDSLAQAYTRLGRLEDARRAELRVKTLHRLKQ